MLEILLPRQHSCLYDGSDSELFWSCISWSAILIMRTNIKAISQRSTVSALCICKVFLIRKLFQVAHSKYIQACRKEILGAEAMFQILVHARHHCWQNWEFMHMHNYMYDAVYMLEHMYDNKLYHFLYHNAASCIS